MTYQSPFEALYKSDATAACLEYTGTLEKVLKDLASPPQVQHLNFEVKHPASNILSDHPEYLALHPPRILRAVMDYKISHPDSLHLEQLLQDAINYAIDIYKNPTNAPQRVKELKEKIESIQEKNLLTNPLQQKNDLTTWDASAPEISQKTATDLAAKIASADVLFIALGHGGIAAGMDVFLRYCSDTGNTNSTFYTTRMSSHKLGDFEPRLTTTEIEYLLQASQNRQLILFDEDRNTGRTLARAQRYFASEVFPSQEMILIANSDEFLRKQRIQEEHDKYFGSVKHLSNYKWKF